MKLDVKPHPVIPGLYVAPDGRVFQELTASPSSHGYRTVKIGSVTMRRHRLVLEAYQGLAKGKQVARHLDGDPTNDHKDNLAWGTQKDNMQDAVKHGTTTKGERNHHVKLTEAKALEILDRLHAGESGSVLAKEFGVTHATLCDLRYGRTWKHLPRP